MSIVFIFLCDNGISNTPYLIYFFLYLREIELYFSLKTFYNVSHPYLMAPELRPHDKIVRADTTYAPTYKDFFLKYYAADS